MTFKQYYERVNSLAAGMSKLGVKAKTKVHSCKDSVSETALWVEGFASRVPELRYFAPEVPMQRDGSLEQLALLDHQ
eukprot:4510198-Amphidinium_carterae.1